MVISLSINKRYEKIYVLVIKQKKKKKKKKKNAGQNLC